MASAAENILANAVNALTEIEDNGLPLDDFLDNYLSSQEIRGAVSSLLFTFFRRRLRLTELLNSMLSKPPKPFLRRVLLSAMTQIFFARGIAPESAVNVAVAVVKKRRGKQEAGFVNAVLRRAAEMTPDFPDTSEQVLPPALLKIWRKNFSPAELDNLTKAFLTPAGNTFRCRRYHELNAQECGELEATPVKTPVRNSYWQYCSCKNPAAVWRHPDWEKGRFYFQDPATCGAMSMPDYSKVKSVLDICAAPGGKALMAAEMLPSDGRITAADRSARRQQLTSENFIRWGIDNYRIITASPWEYTEDLGLFDLVIADVPCSNTGVFRRRPDALWRYNPAGQEELHALQRKLLEHAAGRVAPHGQLLYSTCSIEAGENSVLAAAFAVGNPDFELRSEVKLLPSPEHDGAYGALFVRRK